MAKLMITDEDVIHLVQKALNISIGDFKKTKEGFELEIDAEDLKKEKPINFRPLYYPVITPVPCEPCKPYERACPWRDDYKPTWCEYRINWEGGTSIGYDSKTNDGLPAKPRIT